MFPECLNEQCLDPHCIRRITITVPQLKFLAKTPAQNLTTAKKANAVNNCSKLNQHYESDLAYKNYHTW